MYKKRIIAAFLACLFVTGILLAAEGFYTLDRSGTIVQPGSCTNQEPWETAGLFLAAGAEPTTPGGVSLYYSAFAAVSKAEVYRLKPAWNNVIIRALSHGAAADVDVFDIFLCRGTGTKETFFRIGTFSFTPSGNPGPSFDGNEGTYATSLTITNEIWLSPIRVLTGVTNYYAMAEIDPRGYSYIGIVPTTLHDDWIIQVTGF